MIVANRVIYIKLGRGGKWEKECIEERQTIRLGYGECSHEDCLAGRWDAVEGALVQMGHKGGFAKQHVEHIRRFYEADSAAVWITFYNNRLWWCRADGEVVVVRNDKDQADPVVQERRVLGKWGCHDLEGNLLDFARLSGKLLSLRSYRWTTRELLGDLAEYVVDKINGRAPRPVQAALGARADLVRATEDAIKSLHPGDFEILVDLLFREAGWNRISEVGGVQKIIDLDLRAPITNKRCAVQVKCGLDASGLSMCMESLKALEDFDFKYIVVHSPQFQIPQNRVEEGVEIVLADKLAEWCVGGGLVDWVLNKAC